MDVSSLAATLVSQQAGALQSAIGTQVLKSSLKADASVLQLLQPATQNSAANLAAGVGGQVDRVA